MLGARGVEGGSGGVLPSVTQRGVPLGSSDNPAFRTAGVSACREVGHSHRSSKWHSSRVPFGSWPNPCEMGTDVYPAACEARYMTRLLSLYKARGIPVKSPLCAICLDRTRGKRFLGSLPTGSRSGSATGITASSSCGPTRVAISLRRSCGSGRRRAVSRVHRGKALEWHLRAVRTSGGRFELGPGRMPGPGSGVRHRGRFRARRSGSGRHPASAGTRMPAIRPRCPAFARCVAGSLRLAGCDFPSRASRPPWGSVRPERRRRRTPAMLGKVASGFASTSSDAPPPRP